MINKTPEIAIIEPNTLTALGLQTILEELIPDAIIRVFPSFAALIDDTPDMYAHYFVSIHIYFEHTSFFLERFPKAIVLSDTPCISENACWAAPNPGVFVTAPDKIPTIVGIGIPVA